MIRRVKALSPPLLFALFVLPLFLFAEDVVTFSSGELTLHGALYKPEGSAPFPAVLYNHGSAPGMHSKEAFDALGPVFAKKGWIFSGRTGEAKV
jgi:dipeptidyl aminopeptidase/acylaminoacyl peptidase